MSVKIYKREFMFGGREVSLAKNGDLFGLWNAEMQQFVLPCEYESLKVSNYYFAIFQQGGKKGVMNADLQTVIDNSYDDIGIVEHYLGLAYFWGCKDGLYKIFNNRGEIVMSDLPHWNVVEVDMSLTMVRRFEWSKYSVWSTDYSICRSPLNLLIDELNYPLAFPSMHAVFEFGRRNAERTMTPQEQADWIISGWYHMSRRLDELAAHAGLHYNTFSLEHLFGTIGGCYHKAKAIIISPELLRQPPLFTDSVLAHEISHLKYPNHGERFWNFYETIVPLTRYEDVVTKCALAYWQFLRGIDIHCIVNGVMTKLYDSLSSEQRCRLPLKKIPLEGVEMVMPIHG